MTQAAIQYSGIEGIDEGHGRLLDLLEKLAYNPENLEAVLQELVDRFHDHCRDEEALMQAREYGGREAHAAEHRVLAAHFSTGLPQELRSARSHPALLLAVARARQMLQDHIQCQDLDLAAHLVNTQGQEPAQEPARKAGKGTAKAGKGAGTKVGKGTAKAGKEASSHPGEATAKAGKGTAKAGRGAAGKAGKGTAKAPRGGKARPPRGTP